MNNVGDILVLGLGRSGMAVGRHAASLVVRGEADSVTAMDVGDTEALRAAGAELAALGVGVILGSDEVVGRFDLCVASPGIPPHAAIMRSAVVACTRTISEIEFAYSLSTVPWVAVTGTNGKTTTTALVAHLLNEGGIRAEAVGNIGVAATDTAGAEQIDVLVAEVSSFQLALTSTFHPKVAVLLNITPDHIDWHGSLEAYAADKARIFENLGSGDTAVVDVDDEGSRPYAEKVAATGATVARVSTRRHFAGGATVSNGMLTLESGAGPIHLIPAAELQIKGAHNISNALAAAAAAHAMGVSAVQLQSGLRSFRPIEHRLEPVATVGGVEWFNDSKATNPDAVFKALGAFDDQPVIVLLGGRNKGNDFRPLAEEVARRAKAAVLFGESRMELAAAFEGLEVASEEAISLDDAIEVANALAVAGDVVVLSPACASFDEFDSYEHRGRFFKSRVGQLAREVGQ
jgi:UDP-N-acetylmuramoylalanine--D-glutamate ligase